MIGGSEILLILLAVLLLFGADKLPEFAKTIGKGMREIKKATDEIKDEITREADIVKTEMTEMTDDIKKSVEENKKHLEGEDPLSRIS